jgi:hypothetical protein
MRFHTVTRATAAIFLSIPFITRSALAQVVLHSSTVEEHTSSPGERYSGSIVLSNASDEPLAVRIYQTDYSFAANGTSEFPDPGTLPRSNARWVTLQGARIVIPAKGDAVVPYTVAVPKNDSLSGSYWSVIMVEGVAPHPAPSVRSGTPTMGLSSIVRYGIQVATHIDRSGKRTIRFADPSVSVDPSGKTSLDLDVFNDGERGYRPTVWIEVYDVEGIIRGKARQVRGLVYPGSSFHQHFDLGVLPKGKYKAVVFGDSGNEAVFARQFTINL